MLGGDIFNVHFPLRVVRDKCNFQLHRVSHCRRRIFALTFIFRDQVDRPSGCRERSADSAKHLFHGPIAKFVCKGGLAAPRADRIVTRGPAYFHLSGVQQIRIHWAATVRCRSGYGPLLLLGVSPSGHRRISRSRVYRRREGNLADQVPESREEDLPFSREDDGQTTRKT